MKIRIKGNSLRYRITQSEMNRLWKEGYLEEQTAFAAKPFVYAIQSSGGDKLLADFNGHTMVLHMPKKMIDELHHSDKVGFEDRSGPVDLLVEKDFVCLDKVDEDQSDNYPHPHLNC